ncbi:HPr kinase/phosphorylase [Qipengyuania sediminis]|uniref:HPr kinase/phosphorylase n=1 Tax=Qipengyuania sediminis TaxID=1532023 RepID=UPI001059A671|nr:HPr kinase/phosphatase C-terminal domain-containing protein [Qipengyuania sediminis]
MTVLANVTCVAIEGRGLLLEGAPGSGKSTLALALIDRGATLIGDDGVTLATRESQLWAQPPPNIAGRIEIRGIGIAALPTAEGPVSLVLTLGEANARLPELNGWTAYGHTIPRLAFAMGPEAALRAEWALALHGLPPPAAA